MFYQCLTHGLGFFICLKWYYDQKSPYLFFLHFESIIYKYLPCQILGHDFDKKYEFLDYELSIKLPAITQLKMAEFKRELGWGRIWRYPIKTSQQTWLLKYAEEECDGHVLSFVMCFFVYAGLGKDYAVKLLRCLIGWRHILPRPNSLFWTRPFLNWVMAGNRFENS